VPARLACDEIKRFPNGQDDSEIQIDAVLFALRTGNSLQHIRNVRLGTLIKLHVGMDGERIATLEAHPFAFAIGLHGTLVDAELVPLADGAPDGAETRFDLFDGDGCHGSPSAPKGSV